MYLYIYKYVYIYIYIYIYKYTHIDIYNMSKPNLSVARFLDVALKEDGSVAE